MHCRSPGPHPGGKLCLAREVSRPTPGGVSRPTPWGSPGTHPGGIPACSETDTPQADGYCCGRYTSYWNAYLFLIYF